MIKHGKNPQSGRGSWSRGTWGMHIAMSVDATTTITTDNHALMTVQGQPSADH